MLHEKNMELKELQIYTNNMVRCIGIVHIFWKETGSPVQKYHQALYFLTSQLYTNHNIIQQASGILSISE